MCKYLCTQADIPIADPSEGFSSPPHKPPSARAQCETAFSGAPTDTMSGRRTIKKYAAAAEPLWHAPGMEAQFPLGKAPRRTENVFLCSSLALLCCCCCCCSVRLLSSHHKRHCNDKSSYPQLFRFPTLPRKHTILRAARSEAKKREESDPFRNGIMSVRLIVARARPTVYRVGILVCGCGSELGIYGRNHFCARRRNARYMYRVSQSQVFKLYKRIPWLK